jgi:phosphoribosylformylglycinamidine synthase
MGFQREGDVVLLAGDSSTSQALAGSRYLAEASGVVAGKPALDFPAERALQAFVLDAAERGVLRSAHDLSAGGLAVALAESCLAAGIGAQVDILGQNTIVALYGEAQSRALISCDSADIDAVIALARTHGLPLERLGVTAGERLRLGAIDVSFDEMQTAYESGLAHALEGVTANL